MVGVAYVVHAAVSLHSAWDSVERVPLRASEPLDGSLVETPGRPGPETESGSRPPPRNASPPAKRSSTSAGSTQAELRAETREADNTATSSPSQSTMSSTSPSTPTSSPSPTTAETGSDRIISAGDAPSVVALVGTDSRSGLDDLSGFGKFPGERADVIVLAIRQSDDITLLSIPRDLHVEDVCAGGRHRIGNAYTRCGERSRLGNLILELERLVGLPIEHAAAVDLAGFQEVVDALGGYEICIDHPLRDTRSGLRLEAGCTTADGGTTLEWLRSRHTERLRDGRWDPVPGVSDLTRNRRQRSFLVDVFDRLAHRSGPVAVQEALRSVAPYLTIDDELSLAEVAGWIWRFRSADIETDTVPVTERTTSDGAAVLEPEVRVAEFVADL